MNNNVQLIYDLIESDLKSKGWDEASIAEAVAECKRERIAAGADDNTICVKELSYLSQESLQKVAKQMDDKKTTSNLFVHVIDRLINWAKVFWSLNWEAKIGLLFLIPPIYGVLSFILNLMGAQIGFESFPESWNCVYGSDYGSDWYEYGAYGWAYGYAATPAIPLYLGLMAIAGAYLIKGNLKKRE